jgi:predicted dehydrogenase
MYVDELQHFLRCVRGQATPTVTGEDGRRVVQIVQAAKKSSELQRAVAV